ncbi:MAG: hypothetical protein ACPF83_01830 [Flavobacteriales bacterium]
MKRLLLLSYHYVPLNSIATQRAVGFVRHLPEHGIYPVVVTHDWQRAGDSEWDWQIRRGTEHRVETHPDHTVIYLPLPAEARPYTATSLQTLSHLYRGRFDLGGLMPASRKAYARFLAEHGSTLGPLDGVLAEFNPHHHLELGYRFARQRALPFCADLRDLWSPTAEVGHVEGGPTARLRDRFVRRSWKKWLKRAAVVSTVSPPLAKFLEGFLDRSAITVRNGVEPDLFHGITRVKPERFTLAYVGTLYRDQDTALLLEFLQSLPQEMDWELHWLGATDPTREEALRFQWSSVGLHLNNLRITGRSSRTNALTLMRSAQVLLYPTWPGLPGVVSGKIYEYLASGTPTAVLSRDPNMDVVELVAAAPNGQVFLEGSSASWNAWIGELQLAWNDAQGSPVPHTSPYERSAGVAFWVRAFEQATASKKKKKRG